MVMTMAARAMRALARRLWAPMLAVLAMPASAATLDASVLPTIQAATFEVVARKPEDTLRYERPLPLEQLPFQERNDPYYSVGTAFAIGGGRYVTAAHVLLVGANALWGAPALRDSGGKVHAIGRVHKFSLEKDFVVFDLREPAGDAALALDTAPAKGQPVFSVGNAYGTGVVIRDGLYTSDTPEQQDGRWQWIRFSAPASPGNSGGPLVDHAGKVIGIVLAKSPNENLNYALPISHVLSAPDGLAAFDQRVTYGFDVFDTTLTSPLRTSFALPLPLDAFFREYCRRVDAFLDGQLAALLAKEPERMFPRAKGSEELLNSLPTMGDLPRIVSRDANGHWGVAGEQKDDVKLTANGYITPGSFGKSTLFHLRRPDDVSADALYGDPTVPMELLLKSGMAKRTVGNANIVVTSLGKPILDAHHTDRWGRRWNVWQFALPYANGILVVMALPVPDGYAGLMRYSDALQAHDQLINAKALADFTYVNFDGTLAQWKEYLRRPELLPAALKDTRISAEYGKAFHYASSRLRLDFTPALQPIQPNSVLTLGFGFFAEQDRVTWDVGEVWIGATPHESTYLMLVRQTRPPAGLDDGYQDFWQKLVHRRHPFDGVARNDEDVTKASGVVGKATDGPLVYSAMTAAEGAHPQDEMAGRLARLLEGTTVLEH